MTIISTNVGKNPLAIIVNKRIQNAVLGCNHKNGRKTTQNHGNPSLCPEWFYEDLKDLLELTPRKDILVIIRDWNAKVGSQE